MGYKDPDRQREAQRRWVASRRAEYLAGRSCVLCGATENLEIDHANPTFKVSHRIWSWARPRLEAELAKCIIVCARCHRERHAFERRSHGISRYNHGCRCDVCVAAKAAKNARYRERVKAEQEAA